MKERGAWVEVIFRFIRVWRSPCLAEQNLFGSSCSNEFALSLKNQRGGGALRRLFCACLAKCNKVWPCTRKMALDVHHAYNSTFVVQHNTLISCKKNIFSPALTRQKPKHTVRVYIKELTNAAVRAFWGWICLKIEHVTVSLISPTKVSHALRRSQPSSDE